MARKSVIEEPENHGRGDKGAIIYNDLISNDLTRFFWRLQGFPVRKDPQYRTPQFRAMI